MLYMEGLKKIFLLTTKAGSESQAGMILTKKDALCASVLTKSLNNMRE